MGSASFAGVETQVKPILPLGLILFALLACGSNCPAATPTESRIPHPDDKSKHIEYFLDKPSGDGPWPTIILLHGHQDGDRPGGKAFVNWGVLKEMSQRGYLAVAVSQPGYGNSTGRPDFCGPFTRHAVSAVVAKVRADGLVSLDRILILGISRGALTAGLIAAEDTTISGLVLISGVYDLPNYVADSNASIEKSAVVKTILAESGGSDAALKARSVLHVASSIKASTLILNGAKDTRTSADQARRLAEQITRNGGDAKAVIYPDYGHKIPVEIRNQDIDPFIDRVLRE